MAARYVPEAGDVVWLNFDPQLGREQRGHRPALVISPASYNGKTSLMLCCPMTSQAKGYPFEVPISGAAPSIVLADQVKSLDWQERQAEFKQKVSAVTLSDVKRKIYALLGRP
jgi:mRNA interferase MazF